MTLTTLLFAVLLVLAILGVTSWWLLVIPVIFVIVKIVALAYLIEDARKNRFR